MKNMMKEAKRETIMSGNEAIAHGAIEAGIGFCASYPGTPSTEITETISASSAEYDIYAEWSANEKVALEAATAASWAGIAALCPMKSLGLNVASDFLLNVNLSGTGKGGLVIVVCDDPRGHSSSNEQDSRFYAKAAQIPLLEPSTYQEAKDVTKYAFSVSQKYEVPVIIRSTTRLSHSRGLIAFSEARKRVKRTGKLPDRLYNVPSPHLRHKELLEKMDAISNEFETSVFNSSIDIGNSNLMMISSGICSMYAREAIHLLDNLKLGHLNLVTTHPIPRRFITNHLERANQVLFVEETDPFVEDEVRGLSVEMKKQPGLFGKRTGHLPEIGEMNTDVVREGLEKLLGLKEDTKRAKPSIKEELLVKRPLTFCAGCTHRNFYWALRKVKQRMGGKLVVAGDIGCYSLGVFYDEAMNTMQAMGSGIGVACGLGQLERFGFDSKVLAIAGDSTFFHACMPGLINARHKNTDLTFVILDNATTAMTGFQTHPGSHHQENDLKRVKIENIILAVEPDSYVTGNAEDIKGLVELIHSTIIKKGLKVLLLDSICRLDHDRREAPEKDVVFAIDSELCKGEKCRICVKDFGCPAISWNSTHDHPVIIDSTCVKCGACVDVCPHDAIREERH
jgi:indolepyruvate ferredoxin oxidoreductase alpha subunit